MYTTSLIAENIPLQIVDKTFQYSTLGTCADLSQQRQMTFIMR